MDEGRQQAVTAVAMDGGAYGRIMEWRRVGRRLESLGEGSSTFPLASVRCGNWTEQVRPGQGL